MVADSDDIIRVFFALKVPEEAGQHFREDIFEDVPVLWYPKENIHLTLHFVGDVEKSELEVLFTVGAVVAEHNVKVSVVPEEFYVAEERVRVKIQPSPELMKLREDLITCLQKTGIGKMDLVADWPHITLGRPSPKFNLDMIRFHPIHFGFDAKSFGLYQSIPGPNKIGQYSLLRLFPLNPL